METCCGEIIQGCAARMGDGQWRLMSGGMVVEATVRPEIEFF